MARVVVTGYAVRYPAGGLLMGFLHHVLGLVRLGHEVCYIEESGWAASCYNPRTHQYSDDPSAGLRAIHDVMEMFDCRVPVCYVNRASGDVAGAGRDALVRALRESD